MTVVSYVCGHFMISNHVITHYAITRLEYSDSEMAESPVPLKFPDTPPFYCVKCVCTATSLLLGALLLSIDSKDSNSMKFCLICQLSTLITCPGLNCPSISLNKMLLKYPWSSLDLHCITATRLYHGMHSVMPLWTPCTYQTSILLYSSINVQYWIYCEHLTCRVVSVCAVVCCVKPTYSPLGHECAYYADKWYADLYYSCAHIVVLRHCRREDIRHALWSSL